MASRRYLETAYREIYTTQLADLETGESYVIGVTSAVRGEGRTTTALGLALAIARDLGLRVLLVELDLQHPVLAQELQVTGVPGLADAANAPELIGSAVRHLEACGVDVLPAGRAPVAISRLLRSATLRDLIATARTVYHVIVLDMPPALSNSDVVPLSGLTDGVLMVVRSGVTPARLVEQATARFPAGMVKGIILSGQHSKIPNWLRRLF